MDRWIPYWISCLSLLVGRDSILLTDLTLKGKTTVIGFLKPKRGSTMRKLSLVLLATVIAGPALSADLRVAKAPVQDFFSTSGWYLGIGSLAATTKAEVSLPATGDTGTITTVGAGIGPLVGYHAGSAQSFKAIEAAIYWQNLGGAQPADGKNVDARFSASARVKFGGVGVMSNLASFLPNLGLVGVFPPSPVAGHGNLPYLSIGVDANQVQASVIGADAKGWQITPAFGMGFMTQVMDAQGKPTGYATDTSIEYTPAGKGLTIGGNGEANLGRKIMARFSVVR